LAAISSRGAVGWIEYDDIGNHDAAPARTEQCQAVGCRARRSGGRQSAAVAKSG